MKLATAEAFLRKAPRRYTVVDIPELGRVRLQSITEKERAEYDRHLLDDKGRPDLKRANYHRARLIVLCVVDEEGRRILGDEEAKKLPDLMDAAVADRVFEACQKHCNGETDLGNSKGLQTTPTDDSP